MTELIQVYDRHVKLIHVCDEIQITNDRVDQSEEGAGLRTVMLPMNTVLKISYQELQMQKYQKKYR